MKEQIWRLSQLNIQKLINSRSRVVHAIVIQSVSKLDFSEICNIRRTDVDPDELTIKIRVPGELIVSKIVQVPREYEKSLLFCYSTSIVLNSNYIFCKRDGSKMEADYYMREVKKIFAINRIKMNRIV